MPNWFLHSWAFWVFLVFVDLCALGTLLFGIGEVFNAVIKEDLRYLSGITFIVAGGSLMWYDTPEIYKKRKGGRASPRKSP